jgi:hypothetical protein
MVHNTCSSVPATRWAHREDPVGGPARRARRCGGGAGGAPARGRARDPGVDALRRTGCHRRRLAAGVPGRGPGRRGRGHRARRRRRPPVAARRAGRHHRGSPVGRRSRGRARLPPGGPAGGLLRERERGARAGPRRRERGPRHRLPAGACNSISRQGPPGRGGPAPPRPAARRRGPSGAVRALHPVASLRAGRRGARRRLAAGRAERAHLRPPPRLPGRGGRLPVPPARCRVAWNLGGSGSARPRSRSSPTEPRWCAGSGRTTAAPMPSPPTRR